MRYEFRFVVEGFDKKQCARLLDMIHAIVTGWNLRMVQGYYRKIKK